MASSHSSSPVPQGSSSDVFFKKEVDSTKHIRPVQSLPDVCPKEPRGDSTSLGVAPSLVTDQHRWTIYHSKVNLPAISKEHFIAYQQEISQREKIHERCKNICPPKDTFDRTLLHTHDKSRTDLEQVPKIFMKPDFALDDSLTFNSVLPWSHFNTAGGKGNRDAASSKLLQEKLSHYLDIVEVNIAHQISLRSEAFFHAMTSQHELQDYLKKTSQAVKMLRNKIAQIDKVMCEGSLQSLRLALTRNNCVKVYNKLKLMATVHQTQPTVQVLLSTSEFVGALDLIATTQEVLQQELQGIHSFRYFGLYKWVCPKLVQCEMLIPFDEKLINLVISCKKYNFTEKIQTYGLFHSSDLFQNNYYFCLPKLFMRSISQIEEIDTDVVMKLADQMRMLNFLQWFDLLKDIFSKFTIFLHRVKATLNIIHSVVLSVLEKNQRTRELEEISQQKNAAKDNSLDTEVAYLIHEGMFISDAFNEGELATVAVDTTSQRNVSPNSEPCSSDSVSEPECATDSSSSKEHTSSSATPGGAIVFSFFTSILFHHVLSSFLFIWFTLATEERKPAEVLIVGGQQYAVVGTVLLLIRIILEYCQCVDNIPSVTTDMLTRLSDLLKYFNSRSCQLVLGAGALQVVGLKTITTKNLALASRCLQLIVHYIPVIRAHFEARLPPKQYNMLRHFDHITKDYHDHIAEISAKLVAIMDSLFDKLLSKYEVKAPVPSACFRNICKQMAKMHEAIFDLLPEEQTQMLFLRINASYKLHLKKQLCHLNVINDGGPQNGLVTADVAFYTGNLQALKGLKDLDLNMAEIWEQKR
uniref:Vacuolar protein sorting-associated protein 54 n=1 Tax=Cavia porcellus TaxID=10141 RepID=H0VCF5_CAVPO